MPCLLTANWLTSTVRNKPSACSSGAKRFPCKTIAHLNGRAFARSQTAKRTITVLIGVNAIRSKKWITPQVVAAPSARTESRHGRVSFASRARGALSQTRSRCHISTLFQRPTSISPGSDGAVSPSPRRAPRSRIHPARGVFALTWGSFFGLALGVLPGCLAGFEVDQMHLAAGETGYGRKRF
jgi:hypothetical protein